MINNKYNHLLVLKLRRSKPSNRYLCLCDCGNKCVILGYHIKSGHTKSCGKCGFSRGKYNSNYKGIEDLSLDYFSNLKKQAEIRNIEFSISIEYCWELYKKQNRKCALSDIELLMESSRFSRRKNKDKHTASLDRIDSTKGYIEGNIQWIHKDINFMKNNLSEDEFIDWCKLVANNNPAY